MSCICVAICFATCSLETRIDPRPGPTWTISDRWRSQSQVFQLGMPMAGTTDRPGGHWLSHSCQCRGFLRHRGTPSHHPFFHGIFHEIKPSSNGGTPMTMETPISYQKLLVAAHSPIGASLKPCCCLLALAICGKDCVRPPFVPIDQR